MGYEAAPLLQSQSSMSRVKATMITSEDVLRSEVPWPAFQSAGIISKEQLELIYSLDKQDVQVQVSQFKSKGLDLAQMFVALLTGVNKDDAVCYLLAMLETIFDADGGLASYFIKIAPTDGVMPFLKLLQRSSLFLVEKAACVVAKILAVPGAPEEYLATFAAWTVSTLKSVPPSEAADSATVVAAMGGLQSLCSTMTGRVAAMGADALPSLMALLITSSMTSSSSSSVQLLYQTLFSLWSLSYSPEAAAEMANSKAGLVAKLVEIVKTSPKEKVIRVSLSTLRNLLGTGSASNDMVVFGLMTSLEAMQARKFADEDIPDDVEFMHSTLQVNLTNLSSWDVYKTELESGKLEWSPSHKSENFWKDNYKSFEGGGCAAVKQLVSLLSSDDAQVLAIACNDISEFIKFSPEGRRLMTQYGAKPLAMAVLKHPDPTVQKHALTCVQRLMVINWEYLNR